MKTVNKEISRLELNFIYQNLLHLSHAKKTPLKKCIALNLSILESQIEDVKKDRDLLITEMIVLDEFGEYALKKGEVAPKGQSSVPLSSFLYNDGYDSEQAEKKIKNFEEELISVEIYVEDVKRGIKVSNESGEYQVIKLEELLEDPNNDLSAQNLIVLNKYLLSDI